MKIEKFNLIPDIGKTSTKYLLSKYNFSYKISDVKEFANKMV